jgi:hypothetical protein
VRVFTCLFVGSCVSRVFVVIGKVLGLEGAKSLAAPEDATMKLLGSLTRSQSFSHIDFLNPKADTCWLSTFFQVRTGGRADRLQC